MRYLLIDKVLYLENNKTLKAIKNVSLSEDIFSDHFLGNPVMPGALQIESLAQAGTILLEVSRGFKFKAVLAMVQKTKFRELVRPGDCLDITVDMFSSEGNISQINGTIHNGKRLVTDGRLTFFLQPIDEFYPPSTKKMTRLLYDIFLRDAELVGVNFPKDEYWTQGE